MDMEWLDAPPGYVAVTNSMFDIVRRGLDMLCFFALLCDARGVDCAEVMQAIDIFHAEEEKEHIVERLMTKTVMVELLQACKIAMEFYGEQRFFHLSPMDLISDKYEKLLVCYHKGI